MNYLNTKTLIKASPAFQLFKKEYAPFIIHFLYSQFKLKEVLAIPSEDFTRNLSDMIDDYKMEDLLENELLLAPDHYINEWVNDGFLRKYFESSTDSFFIELTPEMESVFKWVLEIQKLESGEVVGTKSRFLNIFNLLKELVEESVVTPTDKIHQLELQKQKLEEEIERIKNGGDIKKLDKQDFIEQFKFAMHEANELVSDFRQVERNFAEITKQAQANYMNQISSKGAVLGYVLNADEELMNSDQGKSFKAFWQFLLSPTKQKEFEDIINSLYEKEEIRAIDEMQFFRKLKKYLLDSGKKVNRATDKMADQIRKALSDKSLQENKRIKDIINEIKSLSLSNQSALGSKEEFFSIQSFPEIYLPLERPLWEKKDKSLQIDSNLENANDEFNQEIFDLLLNQNSISIDELISNIDSLLKYKPSVELKEVISSYPLKKGLEELVTYIWIATNKDMHTINRELIDRVDIDLNEEEILSVKFPQVVYNI